MKKKIIIIIMLFMSIFFFAPAKTEALTTNSSNSVVYTLDTELDDIVEEYNQDQDCEGSSNSILGDPNDENSVAWLLQQILNFIKVVGPILVVILSSVDFLVVVVKSDDESMGKAKKKLIKRLILAALLFFIPTLVQVILDVFGMTSNTTCGIQ